MGQAQMPATQHTTSGSIGHKVLAVTRRAWASYWSHRAARATAGLLHALDDRALKDIGLDRSEIESVVYGDCARQGESTRTSFRERRVGMCC